MTNWNDTVTLKTKDKKKIVVPRTVIKYVGSVIEKDYSNGVQEFDVTIIHVDIEWALNAGLDARYSDIKDKVLGIKLDMELKLVLGLLRGDKAAEVLF